MILNKKPLAIAEVMEYVEDSEQNEKLMKYLKKFGKDSKDEVKKLRSSIAALNNVKIKESDIIKLIDFLPQDQKDVNKILIEAGLSEEEANAILNLIKNP
ncbi:MAG: hypothetical protein AABX83_01585 [Nanoarchaeota archaeon]